MAVIKSGASSDEQTIDPTSKAARVTEYDTSGRAVATQSKSTYFAAGFFTPAATATDIVTIFGSASKTVRVHAFRIGSTNIAAGSQQLFLLKRSSNNTAGTFVAATPVQADTTDAPATVAVGHYTVNPTILGTSDGTVNIMRVASPAAVPASFAGVQQDVTVDMLDFGANFLKKDVVLNGTAQGLCLNFNGAALVAGQTHVYAICWTEE